MKNKDLKKSSDSAEILQELSKRPDLKSMKVLKTDQVEVSGPFFAKIIYFRKISNQLAFLYVFIFQKSI